MTRVVNCQIAPYCIPSLLIFRRYLIGCLNVWMFDRIDVLLVISDQIHLYCDRLMTPAALTLFYYFRILFTPALYWTRQNKQFLIKRKIELSYTCWVGIRICLLNCLLVLLLQDHFELTKVLLFSVLFKALIMWKQLICDAMPSKWSCLLFYSLFAELSGVCNP